jgi:galactose-1-phosphate uridylyltransferase
MLLKEYYGQTVPYTVDNETKSSSFLTRIDPLSGGVSKIAAVRAARHIGISADLKIKAITRCDFCNYLKSTPSERIEHESGAVSVPNKYPWEKYDWVTIYPPFGQHKVLLSDLYFDDLERMIASSYDLAAVCARDPQVLEFVDFTNWGTFAGASQQHPHSQRKSVTSTPSPRLSQEIQYCREAMRRYGRNPFDLLVREEAEDGRRVIYNDSVYIGAAFAPVCPDEIIVFPNEPVTHVLMTTNDDWKRWIHPVLGVFPALFFYRGITDMNIAIHMAPFSEIEQAKEYFRWHMHIYPRRSRLPVDRAGAEIGFGTDVIDTPPESTAEILRRWYREGPKEEHLVRRPDNSWDPAMLASFRRLNGGSVK